MANLYKESVFLLFDLLNGKTGEIAKADYIKAKPSLNRRLSSGDCLPRSTPEKEGVPSSFLYSLLGELSAKTSIRMHHFMAIRHGKVINETAFFPYKRGDWHSSYSLCKTLTGMAIGLLMDDGVLRAEDKIMDIFGPGGGLWNSFKLRDLTIKDLLIMASGVSYNEMGALSGNHWTRSFLNSSLKFPPGKTFAYNSMNSYMLSAIVTKLTGKRMDDFLNERLFKKMGISNFFWEPSPEDVTKGGWGLFIRPEDAAKLGLLFLNKGIWKGERLLSEAFVTEATTKQIDNEFYGYGYQVWMGKRKGSYNFDGMLGQNVRVYPDMDFILVNNAGDPEILVGGAMDEIINRYMEAPPFSDEALPESLTSYALTKFSEKLEKEEYKRNPEFNGGWNRRKECERVSSEAFFKSLTGKHFELMDKSNGLFPLILQMFHNNFTEGIRELSFAAEGKAYFLLIHEGSARYKIELNLRKTKEIELSLKGEPYLVAVKTKLSLDENKNKVLTLAFSYLEEVATRTMILRFLEEGLFVEFDETPGKEAVRTGLDMPKEQFIDTNFVIKKAMEAVPEQLIKSLIMNKMNPVTKAILKTKEEVR